MRLYSNLKQLQSYKPKNFGYTTKEEVHYIIDTLHLNEASADDVSNYRDLTVSMWGNMIHQNQGKELELMNSMQSITTVLDYKLATFGIPV